MMRRVILLIGAFIPLVAMAQSPGTVVGTTYTDMQSPGSTGNRIAVGSDGSVFFAWMNALSYSRPRHIYFNRVDSLGAWFSRFGDRVFNDSVTSYCQVAMAYGNRGVVAAHAGAPVYSEIAIDSDPPGYGIFNIYNAPDLVSGNRHTIRPYVAIDRNNLIHLVMTESAEDAGDPQRLCYARLNPTNYSWWPNSTNPQFVDSAMTISALVAASPVSDKVVIAYSKMVDTSIQLWNDVYYILSQDGINWDFINGRVNITNYGSDTDSLWAFTDLALIFDYNDNFHISWNANWSTTPDSYHSKTFLFHYNHATQTIDQIRTPWPEWYDWPDSGCRIGSWNRPICKMDFGVRQVGNCLFAIWTQFDTSDCSAGGCANGDIWSSSTIDGGLTWEEPWNLTNSQTPGCTDGNCDNDNWGSAPDRIDNGIQIFYVNSKSECNNGSVESQMLYLDMTLGVSGQTAIPEQFQLDQNYPNPFNTRTTMCFEIKKESEVKLDVYNVMGEKVASLINGRLNPGSHKVCWDATNSPSGVYFAVLKSQGSHQIRQLALIK